ncbi:TonB-dependent receptor [Parvularcula maris]|uniref:TonB-dependent receptor n=1 Tax=Parvularcula maris TaxID=2965077 RepID=A0A9X2RGJ7_9PROT|nr:TonB-dependent receptor [Parvularcula maris]MCQ8183989.1 TonB-dependent receptor [Parvularcula maris]
MRNPSRKAMLLCCAALPALAISSAFAQDAADEEEDVIVVRGIKKSIADSLDTKKNASSIVEAVSAEDIGKLPDLTIADSLARLPGVTVQRVQGRAQLVSIRGLGPNFSISLLNGREQVSTNDNRSIEFDAYPAELFTQGIVYKTPDATLAANGIAGTVDLRTARPLDYSDRQVTLSGRYVLNDSDELNPEYGNDGYRIFGSYIDQFANDTIGIVLSVTDQSNPTQTIRRQLKPQGNAVVDNRLVFADNPASGVISREFERTSASGTLQWQPTERFDATFDAFYSEYTDGGINRGIETPIASWDGVNATNVQGPAGGIAESVTYTDVGPAVKTQELQRDAELFSYGLNLAYDLTDRLELVADFSRSTVDRQDLDYESFGEPRDAEGNLVREDALFTYDGDGAYGLVIDAGLTDPSRMVLTDIRGWGTAAYVKEFDVEDELDQIRLEANYTLDTPFINRITAGWLFTERQKTKAVDEAFGIVQGGRAVPIPANLIEGIADAGDIGFQLLAWTPTALEEAGIYVREANVNSDILAKTFDVSEEISTFYLQGDIDMNLLGLPLTGNAGVRFVDTQQESTGLNLLSGATGGGTATGLRTLEEDFDDILPNLNLSWEISDNLFLRFGAAKTSTRPRMDDLAANQTLNRNGGVCPDADNDGIPDSFNEEGGAGGEGYDPSLQRFCYTSSGGNTFLRNIESTSYDLSLEKYFGSAGAFSIAIFEKNLDGFVATETVRVDLGAEVAEIAGAGFVSANPLAADGTYSRPVNLGEGSIRGIEATLRLPFDDFLPQRLEGFGTNLTYSQSISEIPDLRNPGETIEIPGLSKEIWNADLYYENFGFRARIAANYRSDYLAEVIGFGGNFENVRADERTTVDGQIGYTFQSGRLEGFTVLFEGYNLTDEPFRTFREVDNGGINVNASDRHELYGRTYTFALMKTF